MECGRHGASSGAHFTAFFAAVEKNIFRTRGSENIDPRVACDLVRAVAPENNFPVQIEKADPDFEHIEDVGVNLGILKPWYGTDSRC
jgi:hypothetical protein